MCQCNAMINLKANQYQHICPIPCLDIFCHENKLSVNILHKNCKFCGTIIPYYAGEVKVNKNVQMRRFFLLRTYNESTS